MSVNALVNEFKKKSKSDIDLLITIHNWVRDNIQFGFTASFETVLPEDTLKNGIGHCNAQADLMRHMLTISGFEARLAFVYIDKAILKYAIPQLIHYLLPRKLFHAVTQVNIADKWISFDSYIFTQKQFSHQMTKLLATERQDGFGLYRTAQCEWNGDINCFSQAKENDFNILLEVYDNLEQAINSKSNTNKLFGINFNLLLKPLTFLHHTRSDIFSRYANSCLK